MPPAAVAAAVRFREPHVVVGCPTELAITAVGLVRGVNYRLVVSVSRIGHVIYADRASFTRMRKMAASARGNVL